MRRTRQTVFAICSVTVLACFGAAGAATLFAAEIVAEGHGHSIDPTDPMNFNSYALRNDSGVQLYVRRCDDAGCSRFDGHYDTIAVRPGAATEDLVYWGSSTPTGYAVATSPDLNRGRRCLVLDASKKAPAQVQVRLSSAGPCHG